MTHIDPFAPADSPQHPAIWNRDNWDPRPTFQGEETPAPPTGDHYFWLIALTDQEPYPTDLAEGGREAAQRYEELHKLITAYGTEDERTAWLAAFKEDRLVDLKPGESPTLVEMRVRKAAAERDEATPPAPVSDQDKAHAADLAAKLAALEAEGL